MTEGQIVQKVCEIMEIEYSHYDNHEMTIDYFGYNLKHKPKIVSYSIKYGFWEFAILEDMSIITPISMMGIDFLIDLFSEKFLNIGLNEEQQKYYEDLKILKNKIQLSEQFLKENDCQMIINNSKKRKLI